MFVCISKSVYIFFAVYFQNLTGFGWIHTNFPENCVAYSGAMDLGVPACMASFFRSRSQPLTTRTMLPIPKPTLGHALDGWVFDISKRLSQKYPKIMLGSNFLSAKNKLLKWQLKRCLAHVAMPVLRICNKCLWCKLVGLRIIDHTISSKRPMWRAAWKFEKQQNWQAYLTLTYTKASFIEEALLR